MTCGAGPARRCRSDADAVEEANRPAGSSSQRLPGHPGHCLHGDHVGGVELVGHHHARRGAAGAVTIRPSGSYTRPAPVRVSDDQPVGAVVAVADVATVAPPGLSGSAQAAVAENAVCIDVRPARSLCPYRRHVQAPATVSRTSVSRCSRS